MSFGSTLRWTCLGVCFLALGCNGDPTAELIAQLRDPDVAVRRAAVKALGDHDSEPSTTALAGAVNDSDLHVRRMAIQGLGQHGSLAAVHLPDLELMLKNPELSLRLAAALAIQAIDPSNEAFVPVLLRALRDGEGGIFLDVGEMGADAQWAVPTLTRLLTHQEASIRHLSAITLGQIGPTAEDATSALQRALRDPKQPVRDAAQQALEQIQALATTRSEPPSDSNLEILP